MSKKRILVIEDEPHIAMGLKDALEFEGFDVETAGKGRDGINLAKTGRPDCLILDLMLPDVNGYQVCEEVRRLDPLVPIIMLTARAQEADKVRGLSVGADDYVTKPFSVNELVARIRAIFRRAALAPGAPETFLVGDAEVNLSTQQVRRGKVVEPLSFYEVELLRLLHAKAGVPVSRDEILAKVWGLDANPTNRTVDNFVVKLRKKIEPSPDRPVYILTVYGTGYKLATAAT
ncbi:MAG: response regulator transcription factor [Myxococcales bacterium]|nr:response regulator transcription factor [Myxococcales bacterium]